MPYAINVADLVHWQRDPVHGLPLQVLLATHLEHDPEQVVYCNPERFDEVGTRLACSERQAEAIVQLIRRALKPYELRIYQSATGAGGWKRV